MANFIPEQENYKELTPFKLAVLQNFPYIEADFDALTNYGLMCKIVEYLNTVISNENAVESNVTSLYNAFVSLQNYVNDYFDNLDVQEEINNKLDVMARDGSLTTLIKGYVDPIIENLNNEFDIVKDEVASVTSGSPAGVYQTLASLQQADPDHSRIYVVESDGEWYFWNNNTNQWKNGGVYQATLHTSNSVKFNMLDTIIKDYFDINNNTELINLSWEDGYFYDSGTGAKTSYTGTKCASLNVSPGEIYHAYGYSNSSALSCILCNSSGSVIDRFGNASGYNFNEIVIPENGAILRINSWGVANDTIISKTTSLTLSENDSFKLNNELIDIIKPKENSIKCKSFTTNTSGIYTRAFTIEIPKNLDLLNDNDIITLECDLYTNNVADITSFLFWTHQSGGSTPYKVNNFNRNNINYKNKHCIINKNDNMAHVDISVINTPYNNDNYSYFVSVGTNSSKPNLEVDIFNIKLVNKTQNIEIPLTDYVSNYGSNIILETFDLIGRYNIFKNYVENVGFTRWYAIGDSITEKNYRAKKNYIDYCVEELKYIQAINKGASGTGYKAYSGRTFIDRISQITDYNFETDIITVMGSINDKNFVANNLGQIGDTSTDTLYGAMYTFFNTLFTNFNGVRVGCISPINWKGSNDNDELKKYTKALKDTCELFNVPFLDITHSCNLRPDNTAFLNEFYMSDNEQNPQLDTGGVHPNSKGHRIFSNEIKEFIKKL